jgi:hypothetical protein
MTGREECAEEGCSEFFASHRWGATLAHGDGWLIQKNGDSWCPDHLPAWVAKWRAKNKRKDVR